MTRVASLYLPQLPIERLRRMERNAKRHESSPLAGRGTSRRLVEGGSCHALSPLHHASHGPPPRSGEEYPPTTGWRPGARWARAPSEGKTQATNRTCHFRHLHPADKPLVTIEKSAQRIIIASACPTALALGLAPGMALTQARALVPELDVRDAEPEADAALLHRLALFAARRWTPRAAVCGTDGLWLDLTGVAHLFGGERVMMRRILRFCAR